MSVVKRLRPWRRHQPTEEAQRVVCPLAPWLLAAPFCVSHGEKADGGSALLMVERQKLCSFLLRWDGKHPFLFFSLDTKCPAELIALPKTHSNIHLRFSYWCPGRYTHISFLSSFIQEYFKWSQTLMRKTIYLFYLNLLVDPDGFCIAPRVKLIVLIFYFYFFFHSRQHNFTYLQSRNSISYDQTSASLMQKEQTQNDCLSCFM